MRPLKSQARRIWCGLAALCLACGPPLAPVGTRSIHLPDIELESVLFEGYRAGEREVEVRAARARIDASARTAQLEAVRIQIAGSERGTLAIRAEQGQLDLDSDDFVLLGSVEGSVGDGQHFRTSEVHYDSALQRLWTEQRVVVDRGSLLLEGTGMELDLESQTLRIKGQVHTTLKGSG